MHTNDRKLGGAKKRGHYFSSNSFATWILPRLTQLTPAFMTGNMKKRKGGGGGGWVGWGGGVGQVSYGKVYLSIGMYC